MRCLTLADALRQEGESCTFFCREHEGNLLALIQDKGHKALALPSSTANISPSATPARHEYFTWLGTAVEEDARQTITALQTLALDKPAWLIVDHYALDSAWESELRPYCQKIMVIDDLADRQHDCDLLLDQTFGRDERDYQPLVPEHCTILTGSYYALLRPEFAEWREYSLQRRREPQLKQLLITLGGVDKDNVTGKVLAALSDSNLPSDCHITIVMGKHAPWLEKVTTQAQQLPWSTEVKVDVSNMAELMANSDLCIGAAGSTTWERCSLGLPSIMLVLAENQRKIAHELHQKKLTYIVDYSKNHLLSLNTALTKIANELDFIAKRSSMICDGLGTKKIISHLLNRALIRRLSVHDLTLVRQWRNHPNVRSYMFNQQVINATEHQQWFLDKSKDSSQHLLIYEDQGKPQGFMSFSIKENIEADWGFYKAPDAERGTGKSLGKLGLDYAFKKIGIKKITAQVIDFNLASLKFHEQLGFSKNRIERNEYHANNKYYDVHHFNISAETWVNKENDIA
jgi:UDP-2,4-diacetamido-2,4,6-trideoxy-beta-L-altropyranose hydrolase/UDP-4-amino-4,6-dideoxy-N-acetyl-beta-L-altrosamine N-acetyltransferase